MFESNYLPNFNIPHAFIIIKSLKVSQTYSDIIYTLNYLNLIVDTPIIRCDVQAPTFSSSLMTMPSSQTSNLYQLDSHLRVHEDSLSYLHCHCFPRQCDNVLQEQCLRLWSLARGAHHGDEVALGLATMAGWMEEHQQHDYVEAMVKMLIEITYIRI